MSEQTTEPATPAAPEAPAAPVPTPPAVPAQETDWKAEARKWESRAKENSTAADRLAEIEEANKTELQKATERAEAAEKVAAESALKADRAEVAAAKGVPMALLSGTTKDELEASADALIAFRGEQKHAGPSSTALERADNAQVIPDLDAEIAAAEKAGDVALSIHLKNQKRSASRAATP